MQLLLAPMEGLMDPAMRGLLTALGGYDRAVSEFVRVSQGLLPAHVWHRYCPELLTGGATAAGTPVYVQIMGPEPEVTADNAAYAVSLGAPGIDLNFGCPSKTVNRRCAGASLLKTPELIAAIIAATRRAVPAEIPVTAKVRLGYDDKTRFLEIAHAVQDGGATSVVVHARTREEGYRPPAHWEYVGAIRAALRIPVIANGEIWTPADYEACRTASGGPDVMLGRGAIARPDLARRLRGGDATPWPWDRIADCFLRYDDALTADGCTPTMRAGRLKQWLALVKQHATADWPFTPALFACLKGLTDINAVRETLQTPPPATAPGLTEFPAP